MAYSEWLCGLLLCLPESRKKASSVKGVLPTSGGIDRSPPLSPKTEFGAKKLVISFIYYPSAQLLSIFFTDWSLKTQVSLPCQLLTNLLFLCLQSIKAACFGHLLGPISMNPPCSWIKMFFFLLLICRVNFIISPATSTLEGCVWGISSSPTYRPHFVYVVFLLRASTFILKGSSITGGSFCPVVLCFFVCPGQHCTTTRAWPQKFMSARTTESCSVCASGSRPGTWRMSSHDGFWTPFSVPLSHVSHPDLQIPGMWKTEGRRRRGRQRMRWLDGITDSMDTEFEQTPGDGEGPGSLACYSPWGRKESNTTEWLSNKQLKTWISASSASWDSCSILGFIFLFWAGKWS